MAPELCTDVRSNRRSAALGTESELGGWPPGSGRVKGGGDVREARETRGSRHDTRQVAQPGNRQKRTRGLAGLSGLAGFCGAIRIVAAIVRGSIRSFHRGGLLHRAGHPGQRKLRVSLKGKRYGKHKQEECPEATHDSTVASAALPRKQNAARHRKAIHRGHIHPDGLPPYQTQKNRGTQPLFDVHPRPTQRLTGLAAISSSLRALMT